MQHNYGRELIEGITRTMESNLRRLTGALYLDLTVNFKVRVDGVLYDQSYRTNLTMDERRITRENYKGVIAECVKNILKSQAKQRFCVSDANNQEVELGLVDAQLKPFRN